MSIEDDITKVLAEWHAEPADPEAWQVAMFEDAVVRIMPLVKRAQAEAGAKALRGYRTRLMDQNIDRFGIVLPDLHEVLDDLGEEADRIEKEAGA